VLGSQHSGLLRVVSSERDHRLKVVPSDWSSFYLWPLKVSAGSSHALWSGSTSP